MGVREPGQFAPAAALEGLFCGLLLFVASGAVFSLLRRPGGEGTVSVNAGGPEGTLYIIGFAITGLLAFRFRRDLVLAVRGNPLFWALPLFALLSTVWSTDRSQSLHSAITLTAGMLFGAYFAVRFSVAGQLRVIGTLLAVLMIMSVASAMTDPYIGIDRGVHAGAWRGVFSHKNLFGRINVLTTATFTLLALYRKRTRAYSIPLAVAALTLVWLSQSRTAFVVVAATLAFVGLRSLFRRVNVRLWMIIAAMAIGLLLLGWLAWSQRTSIMQHDSDGETLSGRTVLWAASLLKLAARPWLGYGYDAFWNGHAGNAFDVQKVVGWPAPNSHDSFVDVALDLGIVGLALFAIALSSVIHRALKLFRSPSISALEQAWPSTLLVFVVLASLTEGQLLLNHAYWMLVTAAVVTTTRLSTNGSATRHSNDPERVEEQTEGVLS